MSRRQASAAYDDDVHNVPTIAPEDERDMAESVEDMGAGSGSFKAAGRLRAFAGYTFLAVTISLWTLTNFLASTIFADDTYSKPFLVTYVNSTFFVFALIPLLIYKAYVRPEEAKRVIRQLRLLWTRQYMPLKQGEGDGSSYHDSPVLSTRTARRSISPLPEVVLSSGLETSQELLPKSRLSSDSGSAPLTVWETALLSLQFSPVWFLANYFVSACLQYTTVASATILTSTSSVFTLLFGVLFRVEHFTPRKLIGVLASLVGIILISSIDLSGKSNDDEHRGNFPEKSASEITVGNCLAFLSAVMYGFYAAFLKKRVPDESRVDMPLFFGLVGLFNMLLLWPGFFVFHLTGVEPFELPPDGKVLSIVLGNSLGSLVSDVAWAYAVLFLTPIVVTVGLSMTIPLSLIAQIIVNKQTTSAWYWLGACIVVLSFVFVDNEEKRSEVRAAHDDDSLVERRRSVW